MPHTFIEEQTLPRYYKRRYYPVRPGQTFNDRYRIIAKLGYGAYSTVWLAKDERSQKYKSIKICVRGDSKALQVGNESKILRHFATAAPESEECKLARLAEDQFEVDGHQCFVLEPQACSLQDLQDRCPDWKVPKGIMMPIVLRLAGCINWLQLEGAVVHAGMSEPRGARCESY